jgi:hypothetical protein
LEEEPESTTTTEFPTMYANPVSTERDTDPSSVGLIEIALVVVL